MIPRVSGRGTGPNTCCTRESSDFETNNVSSYLVLFLNFFERTGYYATISRHFFYLHLECLILFTLYKRSSP